MKLFDAFRAVWWLWLVAMGNHTYAQVDVLFSKQTLNWRRMQTPVRDQGLRGTCTAFAVAAMLEPLPGVPADLSEQYLYAALKYTQHDQPYEEGDRLGNYLESLSVFGLVHEENLPYNPHTLPWEQADTEFERLVLGTQVGGIELLDLSNKWGKYSVSPKDRYYYQAFEDELADPQIVKELLERPYAYGVAVSYAPIYLPEWVEGAMRAQAPWDATHLILIEMEDGEYVPLDRLLPHYGDELLEKVRRGEVSFALYDLEDETEEGHTTLNYGGHAVTIVGYNDHGFIFKNSWGTQWGDDGYGYISFDSHKLLCREVLAVESVTFREPQAKKKIIGRSYRPIRLKTTYEKDYSLSFSIYTTSMYADTRIASLTYEIYDAHSGKLLEELTVLSPLQGPYPHTFYAKSKVLKRTPLDRLFKEAPRLKVYLRTGTGRTYVFEDVRFQTTEYAPAQVWDE